MLTSLTITNFKSFRRSEVPLSPLTLLIGANGSGKSNLLDALRFLKAAGDGTPIRDAIEGHVPSGPVGLTVPGVRGGARELTNFRTGSSVFALEASIQRGDSRLRYSIRVDASTYHVVDEELWASDYSGAYVFSTRPKTSPIGNDPASESVYARYHRKSGPNPRRGFSRDQSILSQFRGRSADSNENDRLAEIVRQELSSIRPLELRPEVLGEYAPLGRFVLGEHGENFAAVVWRLRQLAGREVEGHDEPDLAGASARERLEAIEAWLSELTPRPVREVMAEPSPTGEVVFVVREAHHAIAGARVAVVEGRLPRACRAGRRRSGPARAGR